MRLYNRYTSNLVIMLSFTLLFACSVARKNTNGTIASSSSNSKVDTTKRPLDSNKTVQPKAYKEVITNKAVTSRGLFTVHRIDQKYYFEIPDSLLNKEILLVSRIAQGAAGVRGGMLGYGGDEIGESVIAFSKGPNNKLLIRLLSFSYRERSADSSKNGMYRSLQGSNLKPIIAAFDIKAIRPDSLGSVIDVTDFLNSDNAFLYLDAEGKKQLNLGGYQKDKSYIESVQSCPLNVELQAVNTYMQGDIPISIAVNASFVQLPEKPMSTRLYDDRVGYFTRDYLDYDAPGGIPIDEHGKLSTTRLITRWRMEPKEEDKERYLRGELVEPKKPIVFYIDPATPKKWVPYLIEAVNDWQRAFEKAGFKKAIYALEAPTNDSTFSLLDASHSAIIYKASGIPNASGPQINDPRTGEILESHVNWYHNVQQLLHSWYMIQAGPNDRGAQKMVFDDSLMGQLISFVCAHEVGHTLGLRHNLAASSFVPVDSLRSKTYLDKNGFCPSIMDYARFNYVAQPEDGLSRNELMPRIGAYDEWAIDWGYRWLPVCKTKEEEAAYMNNWLITSLKKDKRLQWIEGEAGFPSVTGDPRVQAEDLGDDAMKANYYGVKNLKRVMANLDQWAVKPNKDYKSLELMYQQVLNQFATYMIHVANNIGNKYATPKMQGQEGPVLAFIPRDIQKRAVHFLGETLFDNTDWLYNKKIFGLVGGPGEYAAFPIQKFVIEWLVTYDNYVTMSFAQMQQPKDAYSFDEFLTDFEAEIWKELKTGKSISYARRNLQKLYVERLLKYTVPNGSLDGSTQSGMLWYDCYPIFRKHVNAIISQINRILPRAKDEMSRSHLLEVKRRLIQGLDYNRFPGSSATIRNSGSSMSLRDGLSKSQEQILFPMLKPGGFSKDSTQNASPSNDCDFFSNLLPNQK